MVTRNIPFHNTVNSTMGYQHGTHQLGWNGYYSNSSQNGAMLGLILVKGQVPPWQ